MATTKEKVYRVEFNQLQMQLIKDTIEKTPYLGVYSDEISSIREKVTVEDTPPK